jgi:hypothetical protein
MYDASLLPTYLGPLARMYFFWKSRLTKEEKNQRKRLFGSVKQGFSPVRPFFWKLLSGQKMLEIPITTIPVVKTSFHLTYLLYLNRFSTSLMSHYLRAALTLCRITKTAPSFLLHPLDILGSKEIPELAFFPGMDLSSKRKVEVLELALSDLKRHFTLVTMACHAQALLKKNRMKVKHIPETSRNPKPLGRMKREKSLKK